jgi:hypothetical protein
MKNIFTFACALLFAGLAQASTTNTPPMSLGIDFSQPYLVTVDGNGVQTRGNINLGVDYRYFTNDNLNVGLRYGYDVEKQTGSNRVMTLSPGIQYQWFQGQTWMPFVRSDLPVFLQGAASSTGSSSQKDMGFGLGGGIAWNIGNQIGIDHLILRYDFTTSYIFGIGNALSQFGIEFFKIGMDYRF